MVVQNNSNRLVKVGASYQGIARKKNLALSAREDQACAQPNPHIKLFSPTKSPEQGSFTSLNEMGNALDFSQRRNLDRVIRAAIPFLRNKIRRSIQDSDEIDDVLSEVLLALAQGLSQFRGQAKLTTWIYSIVHHKVCDHIDRNCRLRKLRAEAPIDPYQHRVNNAGEAPNAWDLPPDRLLIRNRVLHWAELAIAELPADQAEALKLREREGFSSEEVAKQLGESDVTIRVRIHRAKKKVIENVQEKLSNWGSAAYINQYGIRINSSNSARQIESDCAN